MKVTAPLKAMSTFEKDTLTKGNATVGGEKGGAGKQHR
ncbi:hypothetical protein AC062_1139 [Pasteurellaceae bacterium NI1060]|nr:hypothetical protein AC062_1139 [Pasteurellaceae bacterium NI1060]